MQWIVQGRGPQPFTRLPGFKADLPLIGGAVFEGSQDQVQQLRRQGLQVVPDAWIPLPQTEPSPGGDLRLAVGTQVIGATQAWKEGLEGEGVGVAILDTGIAPHPAFKRNLVAFKDLVNGQTRPYDDHGHGTHVAGIVAAHGTTRGVAPKANLIGVKVLTDEGGRVSDIVKGLQWAVDNKARYNIRVVNLSVGLPVNQPLAQDPMAQAVERASAQGILCVVAAGNNGPAAATVTSPGCAPSALTVGILDDHRTLNPEDDTVAPISGRGPTAIEGLAKPDLVAPGVRIRSTSASLSTETRTGSSMASPFVAGAAALLLGQHPESTAQEVKQALVAGARPLTGPQDPLACGAGVVNVPAALQQLHGKGLIPQV